MTPRATIAVPAKRQSPGHGNNKKAVKRGLRVSLLGRVLLPCYAGKRSSAISVSPSMSAASAMRSATAVRATAATVGGSTSTVTARRRMAATIAGSRASAVTRGRTSAAVSTSAVRTRSDDRLPHVEWRTRGPTVAARTVAASTVAPAFWARTASGTVGAALFGTTRRRAARRTARRTSHRAAAGRFTGPA